LNSHTPLLGSLAYYVNKNEEAGLLFTGDTLFSAGCGKFFEGTADDMYHSLEKIKNLPLDTMIFPGHEYTKNNLLFAKSVEPKNNELLSRLVWAQEKTKLHLPCIPSTLRQGIKFFLTFFLFSIYFVYFSSKPPCSELSFNPFLRLDEFAKSNTFGITSRKFFAIAI